MAFPVIMPGPIDLGCCGIAQVCQGPRRRPRARPALPASRATQRPGAGVGVVDEAVDRLRPEPRQG